MPTESTMFIIADMEIKFTDKELIAIDELSKILGLSGAQVVRRSLAFLQCAERCRGLGYEPVYRTQTGEIVDDPLITNGGCMRDE
jgi:hypothetical protein